MSPKNTMADPVSVRRLLRRQVIDEIAQRIFQADVLDGTSAGADWSTTTDADRQHYRARARRELRQNEPIALDAALYKAKRAAYASLPAGVRMLLTDEGRKHLDEAIVAAIGAHSAQMLHGREEQEERLFEQIHDIPSPRAFQVVPGGRAVESAQDGEGETRRSMSPLAAGMFDALRVGAESLKGDR